MSDTNTTGGYTQSELEEYLAASKKLNADKAYIGETLSLLSAFGGSEFRQRIFSLGHLPLPTNIGVFDLGVELRRGMNALRLVVWNERQKDIYVLEIGKSGQYPTQGIPTWLVEPLRKVLPSIFGLVQIEYGGLRNFLDEIRQYAQ
jgi:hypothetical protein